MEHHSSATHGQASHDTPRRQPDPETEAVAWGTSENEEPDPSGLVCLLLGGNPTNRPAPSKPCALHWQQPRRARGSPALCLSLPQLCLPTKRFCKEISPPSPQISCHSTRPQRNLPGILWALDTFSAYPRALGGSRDKQVYDGRPSPPLICYQSPPCSSPAQPRNASCSWNTKNKTVINFQGVGCWVGFVAGCFLQL